MAGQETSKKKFTEPVSGPELTGPILKPGLQAPSQIMLKGSNPADLAFGAYQRGYYLTALKLALPRAESGDPAAQTLIAELYWKGLGVGLNQKKATKWYEFAAVGGNREAQFAYANILLRGNQVPTNKRLSEKYMREAANAGHHQAQFNMGQIITAKRPTWQGFKQALPFYQAAAEAGIPDAQYALANIYSEAKGVRFNDEQKARIWLERSAQGGFVPAQVDFGIWLANGRGGEKNLTQAREWFYKAAAKGNVIAQNRLARIYAYGLAVERDAIKAGAWHILARRAGFSDSEMDKLFQSLSKIDKKRALEAANQLTKRVKS